jgi:hypothetical protein
MDQAKVQQAKEQLRAHMSAKGIKIDAKGLVDRLKQSGIPVGVAALTQLVDQVFFPWINDQVHNIGQSNFMVEMFMPLLNLLEEDADAAIKGLGPTLGQ